jgi:hypothetical protein
MDVLDTIRPDRLAAFARLTPEQQRSALDYAAQRAAAVAPWSPDSADLGHAAAIYAAPMLASLPESDYPEQARQVLSGAVRTLVRRLTDLPAAVPIPETVADRLPAPDTYDPAAAYATTTADLAAAVIAGADDTTRRYLPVAARQPLPGDGPSRRQEGRRKGDRLARSYSHTVDTQSRLAARLAAATGAPKRTAARHLAAVLADAATVAPHGLAWLQVDHRRRPWPTDATNAGTDGGPAAYESTDPTRGTARLAYRAPGATASPVIAQSADGWTVQVPDPDAPHGLRTIASGAGTLPAEQRAAVLATLADAPPADPARDREADGFAARQESPGPVRKPSGRKRPRVGNTGPTVPAWR